MLHTNDTHGIPPETCCCGVTIWPLDQIVADAQCCVRDSVIDYITAMGTISPAVEGRLVFE